MNKRLDFTSGEKRGLIALFLILITVMGIAYLYRSCGRTDHIISVNQSTIKTEISDSINISSKIDSKKKIRKKTVKNNKKEIPEGRKRNYRDELTE